MKVKVAQLCLTFCDPMDYTGHGILQARILEWVAFPFSRGSSWPRNQTRVPALQVNSLPVELSGKPQLCRHSFLVFFPLWFITGYWIWFPVLFKRTLLLIHPVVCKWFASSDPALSLPWAPLANTSMFSVSVSLLLLHKHSLMSSFRSHTQVTSYGVCLFFLTYFT